MITKVIKSAILTTTRFNSIKPRAKIRKSSVELKKFSQKTQHKLQSSRFRQLYRPQTLMFHSLPAIKRQMQLMRIGLRSHWIQQPMVSKRETWTFCQWIEFFSLRPKSSRVLLAEVARLKIAWMTWAHTQSLKRSRSQQVQKHLMVVWSNLRTPARLHSREGGRLASALSKCAWLSLM